MNRDEVEGAIVELENRRAHLNAIEENRAAIAEAAQDMLRGKGTLEALRSAKAGDEVLVPVGGGTLIRAKLADAKTVIAGIGTGLSMERGIDEAAKALEERLASLQGTENRLAQESDRLASEIQALSGMLREADTGA